MLMIGEKYGKDTFLFIEKFGTANVPKAFAMKDKVDGFLEKFKIKGLTDRFYRRLPSFYRVICRSV
jgi:D-lactate dehydrogenase